MLLKKKSDPTSFLKSWKVRPEARYNHWCRGAVKNQIQLAFRSHWELFREMLPEGCEKILEVGCGRGSISSYFADDGYQCHLLDYSPEILDIARDIFEKNRHWGSYVQGDARSLPYVDDTFDIVVSIGLLEHFESVEQLLAEQIRVLSPGGRLLAYIVPERSDNVQKYWWWVNSLLRLVVREKKNGNTSAKPEVYRNDFASDVYLAALEKLPVTNPAAYGLYPLPMISHSPEFPFSLLPRPMEWVLTALFRATLALRKTLFRKNPWICRECFGQAFLVTAVKK